MADLAVAVIHGMGSQRPGFSRGLKARLREHLGPAFRRVRWREVYWADVLDARERRYLADAAAAGDLDWMELRGFVVRALGDVVAYRRVDDDPDSVYGRVHRKVARAIARLDDGRDRPLVWLAHSLGGHVMSNYIWDLQRGRPIVPPEADTAFQRMRTLAGIVTFGCNLPLFTMVLPRSRVLPIAFPGDALPRGLKARAKWLNLYDPDDVLGYPLRPVNAAYRRTVAADIRVQVGGLLTGWTPLSHQGYWEDEDVAREIAGLMRDLLAA